MRICEFSQIELRQAVVLHEVLAPLRFPLYDGNLIVGQTVEMVDKFVQIGLDALVSLSQCTLYEILQCMLLLLVWNRDWEFVKILRHEAYKSTLESGSYF